VRYARLRMGFKVDPLTAQYTAYNQRRLHYSLLFWACLSLQFSGILLTLLIGFRQEIIFLPILFGLLGISSFVMAFIAWRLHGLEIHYENCLRNIENSWLEQKVSGIQKANITGKISSRKLVIFALLCLALTFVILAFYTIEVRF